MKKEYLIVGGALALGIIAWALNKNKNTNVAATSSVNETSTVNETLPQSTSLNEDLLLQKGSKGQEVSQLQKLMSISSDGVFGTQTEAKLFSLKGVTKITLRNFKNTPNINTTSYAIGTRVMANSKPDTPLYSAIKKADGTHYSDYTIQKRITYGQHVGKVIGVNGTKTWYLIEIENSIYFNDIYFVKAQDVIKY